MVVSESALAVLLNPTFASTRGHACWLRCWRSAGGRDRSSRLGRRGVPGCRGRGGLGGRGRCAGLGRQSRVTDLGSALVVGIVPCILPL